MTASQRIALAVLAGISLGIGILLYLAVAIDELPSGGVLIALGAVVAAGSLPLLLALERRSTGDRGCERAD